MTDASDETLFDIEMRLLLEAVFLRYHQDFRHYATSSTKRRLKAAIDTLGYPSLSRLQEHILRDAEAFSRLLSFLTIGVSEMFRDPTFFRALREEVVPVLATYPSLKVWVAGCSTGEEVVSLSILLREEGLGERALIYATDIDTEALDRASSGIYSIDRIPGFTENYLAAGGRRSLADYYTAGERCVIFDRSLREGVLFSDHSLATDGVFAEVELVTCRNVLIYFDQVLQERAVGLFHEALCPNGFLGLGAKESLRFSRYADAFAPFSPDQKIYRKR